MATATQHFFEYNEVLEELIKRLGIHEGFWKIVFELGFSAANFQTPESPDEAKLTLKPAGVVLIQRVGIVRVDQQDDLTLDASLVNPTPSMPPKPKVKRRR